MANRLKMAMVETVVRLRAQGWSVRRIARELGIDREAVTRYVREAAATGKSAVNSDRDANNSCGVKTSQAPPRLGSTSRRVKTSQGAHRVRPRW